MRHRRGWLLVASGTVIAVAALTGCEVSNLGPGAAEELQQQVSDVSEAAAAGSYEQALQALDDLTARLDTATRQGEVSLSRRERISDAMDAVRLSLETEIARHDDAPAPGPTPASPAG